MREKEIQHTHVWMFTNTQVAFLKVVLGTHQEARPEAEQWKAKRFWDKNKNKQKT